MKDERVVLKEESVIIMINRQSKALFFNDLVSFG
jgi:hypothetical protein